MDPDADPRAGRAGRLNDTIRKRRNPLIDTIREKRIEEKKQILEDKSILQNKLEGKKNPLAHKFPPLGSFPVNNEYHVGRQDKLKYLAAEKAKGKNPYPPKFFVSLSFPEYINKYGCLNNGEHVEDDEVSLAGRIMGKKESSSKQFFYDLHYDVFRVNVVADLSKSGLDDVEFSKLHKNAMRGDIVGVTGYPGKTERGDFYFFARSFILLSHCLHVIPYVLKDQETRYRQRYRDLLLNKEIRDIFKTRAKTISYVRRFLNKRYFLEVETPVLNRTAGGTAARPFVTHYNDLDMKLYMRIAPELYLKQLIVGGLDRVYEIGKQFWNEGIDLTHNPEFTTCEFYMAFADYYDLMQMTEEMLSGMVKELTGGYKIKYHANGYDKNPIEIDFTPPFRRIEVIEELEREADLNIPKDLTSEEANKYLIDACARLDVKCPPPQTTASLLYKLVGKFLKVKCVNPTFIIDHPEIMSPLAKWHRTNSVLAERFELFINQHEVLNAYTELNDRLVKRKRFAVQLKDRPSGDDEAMAFGPTAGWGQMGIDRVTMLLSNSLNIKDVILFPAMRPSQKESAAAEVDRLQGSLLTRTQIQGSNKVTRTQIHGSNKVRWLIYLLLGAMVVVELCALLHMIWGWF